MFALHKSFVLPGNETYEVYGNLTISVESQPPNLHRSNSRVATMKLMASMIGPPISMGKQPPWDGNTSMRNMIHTPAEREEAQTTAPQTRPNSPML